MTDYLFISIQDKTGDSKMKLQWDKKDEEAKAFAKKEFERLKKEGYRIFAVKKVMGLIPVKGKEVKEYVPSLGAVYYEKNSEKEERTFTYEEVKTDKVKYSEAKKFDPETDEITTDNSYVATAPLRAG